MGKFGFGSKSGDADEDSNRSGLFGRKKSSQAGQNTQSDNPYAQNSAGDSYSGPMTPYQEVRARQAAGQRPGVGLPSGPRAGAGGPPPPYSSQQAQQSTGYASEKYGRPGGYGSNPYADNAAAFQANRQISTSNPYAASSSLSNGAQRSGGYGGFEYTNKDDLFGDAQARAAKQVETATTNGYGTGSAAGTTGRYGDPGTYGGYGEQRELTEEEREKEELRAMKNEIRQVRNESHATSNRILDRMDQIIDQAGSTLTTLAGQNERLANTEKNLDMASIHNRKAEEKTRELKHQNRSMFAVSVANPFKSKRRAEERDQKLLDQHRSDRNQREATRREAFAVEKQMEDTFRDLKEMDRRSQATSDSLTVRRAANNAKFLMPESDDEDGPTGPRNGPGPTSDTGAKAQFAEEDEQIENDIDANYEKMEVGMTKIKALAIAHKEQVEHSIETIDRITAKSDAVDDGIRMNRIRLKPYE
ncbi:uncharacterized protein E0L32_003661 [Thyridium curvatum]|uniref:t-SNARE coiled-coil homology domain-containing protein n=1 Tax=Thyridium curvatum TaxID=1093900 RepID=A0A507BJE7_9PEZI|nr:uncharacterized protein E0L32_003661 [Thyridium curvatum]TPX16720.1 hypothetical protein E0L32_003661 [Thyridium curvatum]